MDKKRVVDFAQADFGQEERDAVDKVMEGIWLASGKENVRFEEEFARYVGCDYAVCVNSGSSANLLALQSLNLPKNSKVLTSACGFPATLSPILHLGLRPILVDYDINTHNIDINQVLDKIKYVKAMIFAHTLGNPVDVYTIMKKADRYGVRVIEDSCESAGSKINGRSVGSFGTLGTFSFYPAHQITALGGGGMVTTNHKSLALAMRSLRDWGKIYDWDSYLGDHTTKYSHMIGGIKYFKHYTYEKVGYNMKLPEANAAFGRVQLKKLDAYSLRRMINFEYLKAALSPIWGKIINIQTIYKAEPSWFGYPLTIKNSSVNKNRDGLGDYLEENGIRTRPFFAGNITRHKPFLKYKKDFPVADKLMRDSLFFGIWQNLNDDDLDYIADKIIEYLT